MGTIWYVYHKMATSSAGSKSLHSSIYSGRISSGKTLVFEGLLSPHMKRLIK